MGLKLPILVNTFDGPLELLSQRLGEELFDWHIESLAEDHSQSGIDVVLHDVSYGAFHISI